jgi:hypothetical protein
MSRRSSFSDDEFDTRRRSHSADEFDTDFVESDDEYNTTNRSRYTGQVKYTPEELISRLNTINFGEIKNLDFDLEKRIHNICLSIWLVNQYTTEPEYNLEQINGLKKDANQYYIQRLYGDIDAYITSINDAIEKAKPAPEVDSATSLPSAAPTPPPSAPAPAPAPGSLTGKSAVSPSAFQFNVTDRSRSEIESIKPVLSASSAPAIELTLKKIPPPVVGGELPILTGYNKPIGFTNSGPNHCYLNAALQLFYHVPEFYNFIADANNTNYEGVSPIKQAFAMLEGETPMKENESCIEGYNQQDADHYIKGAIMGPFFDVTNALNSFKIGICKRDIVIDNYDVSKSKYTDADTLFTPDLQVNITGEKPYKIINLMKESMVSITDGSRTQNRSGKVTDTRGHRFVTYTVIPKSNKYLYVHIVRFKFNSVDGNKSEGEKNNDPITVDKEIELNDIEGIESDSKKKITYKLRGFIFHSGGTGGGHYVYYWYNNGNWFLFDDSKATELKEQPNEAMNLGYIYLYERVK